MKEILVLDRYDCSIWEVLCGSESRSHRDVIIGQFTHPTDSYCPANFSDLHKSRHFLYHNFSITRDMGQWGHNLKHQNYTFMLKRSLLNCLITSWMWFTKHFKLSYVSLSVETIWICNIAWRWSDDNQVNCWHYKEAVYVLTEAVHVLTIGLSVL